MLGVGGHRQMRAIDLLLSRIPNARRVRPNHYRAACPAHKGRSSSSFAFRATDRGVLAHCFGGCSIDAVMDALGFTVADLFDDGPSRENPQTRAIRGLQKWRDQRLNDVTRDLRVIETGIQQ